ncbi:MAG: acetate/propionate family kinase [Pseudomonadota bacterium]
MTPIEHSRHLRVILSVNCGSSSLKYALYPVLSDGVGEALHTATIEGSLSEAQQPSGDAFGRALRVLDQIIHELGPVDILAVAHRIVHGGERFTVPVRLDAAAMSALAQLSGLAPLHQPHNLDGVRRFEAHWPGVPQIGCFDTAFHATLPEVEYRFALPDSLYKQGIRRFGFHGLSYEFVIGRLQALTPRAQGRVLAFHLGNGASACAIQQGRSVATSMGFSALDGLVMGSRSGSLDPGVLLHLMRQGWGVDRLEAVLYKESGLRGLSGVSADMRTLHASTDPKAKLAIDVFVHRAIREAGALIACMGGVDVVAFTGGIGEHDAVVRAAIVQGMSYLGVRCAAQANEQLPSKGEGPIHADDSVVELWVVPTDEGRVAARGAAAVLKAFNVAGGAYGGTVPMS